MTLINIFIWFYYRPTMYQINEEFLYLQFIGLIFNSSLKFA